MSQETCLGAERPRTALRGKSGGRRPAHERRRAYRGALHRVPRRV